MTDEPREQPELLAEPGAILYCGWGRLLFAHTFPDPESVAQAVLREEPGKRDIAFYLNDPHLVLNYAPQQLFLDPSNTYRLPFERYTKSERPLQGFTVGRLEHKEEIDEINRIYAAHHMVPVEESYVWRHRDSERFQYVLARSVEGGDILGVAMGVDHMACYDDLRNGSSLWSLAVDPRAELPGVGMALVRYLVEDYQARGRAELDLSVMHDNTVAIGLYEKLGFEKVAVFTVKNRNSINEKLFVSTAPEEGFNPYATIIIKEALRRGIHVEPLDPPRGYFKLSLGGRSVTCRESLSALTSAIALSRTDDKQLTRELLHAHGLQTPDQILAGDAAANHQFLSAHRSVVVKPLHGEQGAGISVDVRTPEALEEALVHARDHDDHVLLEAYVKGDDLRIIVIGKEVVAAAVRQPPVILGTGQHTIQELIERLSRRRAAATGGESTIPLDDETRRVVEQAGYRMDAVLPLDKALRVRKTANLHTGGTIHDVTPRLHPDLARAAVEAAQVLEIGVVGLDFIVPDVAGRDYVIIEANERPGLANHEPQPTAEKFVDFLFPHTMLPETPAQSAVVS